MSSLPNIFFISGELRAGGVSLQIGVTRDANGRGYVTGGFGGSVAMIDAGPVEASATAMLAAGIAAVFGAKASINVGASYEPIEKFVDINNPSVTFAVHNVVGFQADLSGDTFAFTFGPGFVLPGLQVSTQSGVSLGYIPSYSDTIYMTALMLLRAGGLSNSQDFDALGLRKCFVAGTEISMADGSLKPIQEITCGDIVVSFENAAATELMPRKVTKTFVSTTNQIIDLRGLKCTPGHVFLTVDIEKEGRCMFSTISQILKNDSIIVEQDGSLVRARTGAKIDTIEDAVVNIIYSDNNSEATPGLERRTLVRAGIPMPAITTNNSTFSTQASTLAQQLAAYGVTILPDGSLRTQDGRHHTACYWLEASTPVDTHECRNWIVKIDDLPFTPSWICDIIEADEDHNLHIASIVPEIANTTFARSV